MNVTAPVRAGPRPREDTCDSTQRDTVDTKMRFIALSTSGLAPKSGTSGNGGASTHRHRREHVVHQEGRGLGHARVEQDGQTVRGMALGWL